MAVGYVASATSGSQASVASFNIGTLGTGARAGIVFVAIHNSATNIISGVTWNGVSMTLLYSATDTDTEPGVVVAYFLDNVTNGTITVSRTNNAVVTVGYAASISAARATEVAQVITRVASTQNTNANTSTTGTGASGEVAVDDLSQSGTNSMRFAASYTGAATPVAQGTNSTALQSLDSTAFGSSFVRETTAGTGSRNVGFATGTTDDWALVAVAVREQVQAAGGNAAATGAAANAAASLAPTGGLASATGAALNATPKYDSNVPAGHASATGAAHNATVEVFSPDLTGAYAAAIVADTPLSYWRLDESSGTVAHDVIGGRNGVYINTPTLGSTGLLDGDSNKAAVFTAASSEQVEIPDNNVFSLATTNELSLEAWFNAASDTGGAQYILVKGDSANSTLEWRILIASDESIQAFVLNGTSGATVATAATGASAIAYGTTYHVVATLDEATDELRLYLDGAEVANDTTWSGSSANSTGAVRIGSRFSSIYFNGTIDEVAIYDYVLTPTQIANHYAIGSGTAAGTNAPAGNAAATGAASTASTSIAATANAATATGAALGATTSVKATAGVAAATASAGNATTNSTTCYEEAILADGPVGYWRLGESSGTVAEAVVGTDGTYVNTPTLGVAGPLDDGDTAVTFAAASSEYVGLGVVPALHPGDVFSISVWVKRSATGADTYIYSNNAIDDIALWIWGGDDKVYLSRNFGGHAYTSTLAITDTDWHHIAVTKNGATVAGYIDGVPSANLAGGATIVADTGVDTFIGRAHGGYTNGSIDEVAFFDYALTAGQVAAHYDARLCNTTQAPAGHASATAAAHNASTSIAATAGASIATGAALNAAANVAPTAQVASATGSALNASISTIDAADNVGAATATGAAHNAAASVAVSAGNAAATGSAANASTKVSPTANAASATGAAANAAASVAVTAGHASATGAALQASISTIDAADVVGAALATAAAHNAAANVAPNAAPATATGAAYNPSLSTAATSGTASATGSASNPSPSIAVNAGHVSATGAAHDATTSTSEAISAAANVASATGSAHGATTSVAPTSNAATATGAASNPSASVAVNAGLVGATGSAYDATASATTSASASADVATATGQALGATTKVAPTSGVAAATGAALDATGLTADDAPAETAQATGSSYGATTAIAPTSDVAAATGAALAPSASLSTASGTATATGSAGGSTSSVAPTANVVLVSGEAFDATVTTIADTANAQAEVAAATAAAYDATAQATVVSTGGSGARRRKSNWINVPPNMRPHPIPVASVGAYAEVARATAQAFDATTTWDDDEYALALLLVA